MVEVYWKYCGSILGQFIGAIIDLIPISVSEILLQLAIVGTIWILICWWKSKLIPKYFWSAPIALFIMAGSQGISAFDWVPTAHRVKLVDHLNYESMEREDVDHFLSNQFELFEAFPSELYEKAPLDPPLELINRAMQKTVKKYGLVPGREVKAVKKLWGLTRTMGLAYGGPAYHDVITSEVVIASNEDYPASKAWRWVCVMHETAHAQGYTREMDAEILTWLALYEADDPLLNALANYMACVKSGQKFTAPEVLRLEWQEIREKREALNQPLIEWLKRMAQKIGLQNSGGKYGSVDRDREIPLSHEFYRVLVHTSK